VNSWWWTFGCSCRGRSSERLERSGQLLRVRLEIGDFSGERLTHQRANETARATSADRTQASQTAIVDAFNTAAERIERLAKRLNQSLGNGVASG
jgi:hypothetical protein